MRILILGAGKMGSFFTDLLSFNHDVAVLEKDPRRMRFIYNALGNLQTENAIIIKESDHMGKIFFKDLYGSLKLNVCEYTFEGHDEVVAYSLSVPFASTLVFASIMKHQDAPGTTFKKHMAIARGLLSEDDYLLTEILFNPKTPAQIDNIVATLTHLSKIIDKKDSGKMKRFLDGVRKNLE